jgi:hypothetical protein
MAFSKREFICMKNNTVSTNNSHHSNNTDLSPTHTTPHYHHTVSHTIPQDQRGTLGYGIGRLLREMYYYLNGSWKNWWHPPSQIAAAKHRRTRIYKEGLRDVSAQLDAAVNNLRTNPNDPHSLRRLKKIVKDKDYSAYFKSAPTQKLRHYQARLFDDIRRKVGRLPVRQEIKDTLLAHLPTSPSHMASALPSPDALSEARLLTSQHAEKRFVSQQPAPAPMPTLAAPFTFEPAENITLSTIEGVQTSGNLGNAVCIGEDGMLVVAAPNFSPENCTSCPSIPQAGAVYGLFSPGGGNWPSAIPLPSLNQTNGFVWYGTQAYGEFGSTVIIDYINPNGIPNLLVREPYASPNGLLDAGIIHVLNDTSHLTSVIRFNPGQNGFDIEGPEARASLEIATGDVNCDKIPDIILSSPTTAPSKVYILLVPNDPNWHWPAHVNITQFLNGTYGVALQGDDPNGLDVFGYTILGIPDINGDNCDELVIGAIGADNNAGAVYVFYGQKHWPALIQNPTSYLLNGTYGFKMGGLDPTTGPYGNQLGYSLSFLLNANPNAEPGLFVSAPNNSFNCSGASNSTIGCPNAGTVYLLYLHKNMPAYINVTNLDPTAGKIINGLHPNDYFGSTMASANNFLGVPTIAIGAPIASPHNITGAGMVYVMSWPFNPAMPGNNSFIIVGQEANGVLGNVIASGSNVIALGLGPASPNGLTQAGAVYLLSLPTATMPPPLPNPVPAAIPMPAATSAPSTMPVPKPTVIPPAAPIPSFAPPIMPTPTTLPISLSGCPQLSWLNYDITIAQHQQLYLSPEDMALQCNHTHQPYSPATFTVTGIRFASLQQRNASGFFNTSNFTFSNKDLATGRVALLQDGSNNPPELNITATDGFTILPNQPIEVNFTSTAATPVLVSFQLTLPNNGTVTLSTDNLMVTSTSGKLSDLMITVSNVQNGYFSQTGDPSEINQFTYYQVQTGQIQLTHQGGNNPLTFNIAVSNGLTSSVAQSETATLFDVTNNDSSEQTIKIVAGTLAGVSMCALSMASCAFWYRTQKKRETNLSKPIPRWAIQKRERESEENRYVEKHALQNLKH